MGPMTERQRELAQHALGLDNPASLGRSYRNRFYSTRNDPNWTDWHAMVGNGWANLEDQRRDTLFWLNRSGAELALNPGETLDPEDFPRVKT